MPPVPIKYVVSFSSQDDKHPVSNLIKGDGLKKWLCSPQERSGQIEVVVQLEQPCVISYIDIGSIWCASLEVKVGCSDWPAGREFDTLVYTVNLMTPADCTYDRNPIKTQMFASDLFCREVAKQQFDRIKVICRQPYKKLTQFGLSFLRVKSSGPVQTKPEDPCKTSVAQSASVKSIQRHFFGKLSNGQKKSNTQLKSKLLKIAASSDAGTEHQHDDSLSRTAKLVLAASGSKPKTYNQQGNTPEVEKTGMFSSRIEQKYGPKLKEEVELFLSKLEIDPSDLDNITLADIRHRFEKQKRRKLTKDEKKTFIEMAKNFITAMFDKSSGETSCKENKSRNIDRTKPYGGNENDLSTNGVKKPNSSTPNVIKTNSTTPNLIKTSTPNVKVNSNISKLNAREVTPINKRKLNDSDELLTPPSKKALTEKFTSVRQQLKSAEKDPRVTEKCDLIGEIKKARQDLGSDSNKVKTSENSAFLYKGMRGKDFDWTAEPEDLKANEKFTSVSRSALSDCVMDINTSEISNCSINSIQTPGKSSSSFGAFEVNVPWSPSSDEDVVFPEVNAVVTKRGRGRKKSRGQGRGRRRGAKTASTDDSWLSCSGNTNDLGVTSPGVGGLGRGRGKGRGRGRRGKDIASTPEAVICVSPDVEPTSEMTGATVEMSTAPRGFAKCSGCNDFFGSALLSSHQQRCARLKNKTTTLASDDLSAVTEGEGYGGRHQRQRSRSTVASLEMRPTSFVKCTGCNEYYGGDLLSIHQQKCIRWKNLQNGSTSQNSESPWLSSSKPATPISNGGQNLTNQNTCQSNPGLGSADEPVRSPPWVMSLLAAERRLQEQCGPTSSAASSSVDRNNASAVSSIPTSSSSSPVTSPVVNAQRWQYEKIKNKTNGIQVNMSQSRAQSSVSKQDVYQSAGSSFLCGNQSHSSSNGSLNQSVMTREINWTLDNDCDDDDNDDDVRSGEDEILDESTIQVECPLCGKYFPSFIIEVHAASCYL